uniref:uncharacterized protein LOC120326658 n=1 Tax=Styela clava TaxID=7725 RepID=UPI00193AB467|nr:uncharacterized protein LOC120326658 [Styela clava]
MSFSEKIDVIQNLLNSKQKLERDRGVIQLKQVVVSSQKPQTTTQNGNQAKNVDDLIVKLQKNFLSILSKAESTKEWEPIQGSLSGSKCIIDNLAQILTDDLIQELQKISERLLTHDEVRVRLAAGEVLGALCKHHGVETYSKCSDVVLNLINSNLHRDMEVGLEPDANDNTENMETTSGRKRGVSVDAATIYHESAGWRHLETSMECLQFMIEGSGKNFNPYVTQDLLDLIFSALTHENRFVRETGYYVCASLVNIGQPDVNEESNPDHNSILKYGEQFSTYLAKGLADNWSQVRLASSTAARHFLMSIPDIDIRKKFYPTLLPRLCLNRYYVADGVRIYSQETWRQLSEGKGREMVETYIDDVIEYYIKSTKADNHAVREAACACIAELGGKVNPQALKQHIVSLLNALLECFRDDSWPVRDAACVACGNFILNFAEEARNVKDELYQLFLTNMRDPISSVRQGAAVAVANYVKAYGDDALEKVIEEIKEGLKEIEKQPENTEKYSAIDKSPAQFGVVKKLRDNDVDLHTNQTMYSCGSLAPKMGRGRNVNSDKDTNKPSSGGGCSDCRFQRSSEPWERSDGCVFLISELLSNSEKQTADPELATRIANLLPLVVEAAKFRNFTQHSVFIETICRQLPIIGKRLGKRIFKSNLESFFDIIFYGLQSDVQLTSAAAEDCLLELATFLGPSILRGRIEQFNGRFLEEYDKINRRHYISDPGVGPNPGSQTPFPNPGFVPTFPTSSNNNGIPMTLPHFE